MSSEEMLLVGRSGRLDRVPARPWRDALANVAERMRDRLAFMTPNHRAVREAAVVYLATTGRPLSPLDLARVTKLDPSAVDVLLDELHRGLFFLVREPGGDVSWAFPVTVDRTPHHLAFDSGERLWGA